MTQMRHDHFRDLDGMRGVLALGVVLLHLGFNSMTERVFEWKGVAFGLSVDVFFLLSGYVLTHANRNGYVFWRFVGQRFFRLAPVFYATTFVSAFATGNFPSMLEFLMAAPFANRDPLNFPAWSICWEFYLPLAGLLLPVTIDRKWARRMIGPALFTLGILAIFVAQGEQFYFLRAAIGLSSGHFLYRAEYAKRLNVHLAFLLVFAGMALAPTYPIAGFIVPFVACAAIIAGREGGSVFGLPPFQMLGTLSYTIYLAHIPVLQLAQWLAPDQINANPAFKLFLLATSFIFAIFLSIAVERPFMRLSKVWLGSFRRVT